MFFLKYILLPFTVLFVIAFAGDFIYIWKKKREINKMLCRGSLLTRKEFLVIFPEACPCCLSRDFYTKETVSSGNIDLLEDGTILSSHKPYPRSYCKNCNEEHQNVEYGSRQKRVFRSWHDNARDRAYRRGPHEYTVYSPYVTKRKAKRFADEWINKYGSTTA